MKLKILIFLLLPLIANFSFGQKINKKTTIKGIIVDANQNPIAGANIFIDGEKINRTTNKGGRYKIRVKPASEKIGIAILTDLVYEEYINERGNINLTLSNYVPQRIDRQKNDKEEEEVNIGYGTIKKKDLTRSVNSIDGKNKRNASYQSIYDMINGELPGVQVTGRNIRVQGASSINSGTEPLFVVDGITVSSIDNIQPGMVKSIEVLKGPEASIYGSRGGNGVILITLVGAVKSK